MRIHPTPCAKQQQQQQQQKEKTKTKQPATENERNADNTDLDIQILPTTLRTDCHTLLVTIKGEFGDQFINSHELNA